MTRPRAADDFPMIRARMEELRRERAHVSAERDTRPPGPRPYHAATSVTPVSGVSRVQFAKNSSDRPTSAPRRSYVQATTKL